MRAAARAVLVVLAGCSTPATPKLGSVSFDAATIDPPDTSPCNHVDPANPPIDCAPTSGPQSMCSTSEKVASCPSDTVCMARVRQSSARSDLRIGRLRLWRPDALLSLTSIAIDPNVNAHCANGGTESLSWMLRIEGDSLTTGSARPSIDGKTFWFATDTLAAPSECPGFPGTAISIAPVTASLIRRDSGFSAHLDAVNIAVFRDGYALPFRDVMIDVPSRPTGSTCARL